jgi:DNA repair exonuclease SbcCD ATPase subunit
MKVKTKDFQILKGEHEFEFPEGITVIQGKTGSGKTTLFYAIQDCLTNPNGVDDTINWDAKSTSVTIENNNNKITWTKTPTSSEYRNELTGQQFVKASKIDSTDLGDLGFYIKDGEVLNIQDEWKTLFPFGLKDTEMFRLFEDIFNISCSFTIIDDYKKDEKETKSQINIITSQINDLTSKKNVITDILSKINAQDLETYISQINTKKQVVSEISEDYINLSKNEKYKIINVPNLYDTTKMVNADSYYNSIKLDYSNYLNYHSLLDVKLPERKEFNLKENVYLQDYINYCNHKQTIELYAEEIKTLDEQINKLNEELSKIKICPTCGRPLEE